MSETAAVSSVQSIDKFDLRSVGMPVRGLEVKTFNADDTGEGEIVIRGRNVMMGYLNNEQATQEVIDEEGWLHTGDLGRIDSRGFLFITGRIKELIITAGGENIGPLIIEDNFKDACPICSHVMAIGEKRKYLCALVTLKVDVDPKKGVPSHRLTREVTEFMKQKLDIDNVKTTEEAMTHDKVKKYIQECVDRTNQKAVSRAAQIKKWRILGMDFSIPGGELTPTMKVKRKVTEKKH